MLGGICKTGGCAQSKTNTTPAKQRSELANPWVHNGNRWCMAHAASKETTLTQTMHPTQINKPTRNVTHDKLRLARKPTMIHKQIWLGSGVSWLVKKSLGWQDGTLLGSGAPWLVKNKPGVAGWHAYQSQGSMRLCARSPLQACLSLCNQLLHTQPMPSGKPACKHQCNCKGQLQPNEAHW